MGVGTRLYNIDCYIFYFYLPSLALSTRSSEIISCLVFFCMENFLGSFHKIGMHVGYLPNNVG